MKYVSIFFLSLFLVVAQSKAAPGDTTWVQAHNNIWLDYYNNFDTTINFPDGSTKYRKVIMVFTIGKYVCPGSPTYCSDWDYTVQTYAMNKVGDTVELGRMITPYGKGARMPATWQQPFYYDVTDYASVLRDSNKIRIHYSGYSGGFTANVKFAMIEGIPEREVKGVKKLWDASMAFGDAANPIDSKVAAVSLTAPAGTQAAIYRLNITGHGSDANGCSEFCQKYYQVLKDGALVKEKLIWRDNCGFNNLYPQSGTWIYDRGNWCPGDVVHTNIHPLDAVSGGGSFTLGMHFEPYTIASPSAGYIVNGTVIYYGAMNKTLDASLEDIIAPTNNPNHFRSNDRNGWTTIKVRNSGSTTISNIEFEYGVTGQPLTKTTWSGTLAPLNDTVIDLHYAASLVNASGTNVPYEVNIIKVNGSTDEDATNNIFKTTFTPAPVWADSFTVIMRTNAASTGGYAETEWAITDMYQNIVAKRINNAPNTTYRDTLKLAAGIYRFTVSDKNCDGLSFWANPSAGTGSLQIKPTAFTNIALPGYFSGDFGCGFTQEFKVGVPNLAIKNVAASSNSSLAIYPNPAHDIATIEIEGLQSVNGKLSISDYMGKTVLSLDVSKAQINVNTSSFANGLYFVSYKQAGTETPVITGKLVIVK